MSLANSYEDKLLDHFFGKANYTPETIYVALSTTDPGEDGSGISEPSGNGYARVATAPADWNTASGGHTDNANPITYPEATGSWGTIAYFALFNASSGGTFMASGAVSPTKDIGSGDTAKFNAGDLDANWD